MYENIIIKELSKEDATDWDQLVQNSTQGTIFHHSQWLKTCAEALPGKHKIIGCYFRGELVAGCPIRIYNVGPFKISNAFSDLTNYYNGIIMKSMFDENNLRKTESHERLIIESLNKYFILKKFNFIRFINSPNLIDIRPFLRFNWSGKITYTYYLYLNNINLFNNFSRDIKRNYRKAEKLGIEIIESSNVQKYFEIFKLTLKHHKSQKISELNIYKTFFEKIVTMIYEKDIGKMFLAKNTSDEIISGEIILFDNKRVYEWSAANNPKFFDTGASTYLKIRIIENFQKEFNEMDMVEADTPTIASFKAGFNPKIIPHYILEKSTNMYRVFNVIYRNTFWTIKKFI